MTSHLPRELRPPRWLVAFLLVGAVLCVASAVWALRSDQATWLKVLAPALAAIAIAGVVDALLTRVRLTEDALVVVDNFRLGSYPRGGFVAVSWGKGVPVSLQFQDGGWLHLPLAIEPGGLALANILRAWIAPASGGSRERSSKQRDRRGAAGRDRPHAP